MSVLICAATSKYGIMMCDGRAINANTGIIINENYQKYYRINPKLFAGYTGDSTFGKLAIEQSLLCDPHDSLNVDEAYTALTNFCNFVLTSPELKRQINGTIILLGYNSLNAIAIRTIQINNNKTTEATVVPGDAQIPRIACASNIDNCIDIINNSIIQTHDSIINGLILAIKTIAKIDPSVNTNIFYDFLGIVPESVLPK